MNTNNQQSSPFHLFTIRQRKKLPNLLMIIGIVILCILGLGIMPKQTTQNKIIENIQDVRITVLYDNYIYKEGLQTDWGFSCLVEYGETKLLFDTGEKGDILLKNMEKLGINPKAIDIVVLSHHHSDHIGGLFDFLKKNSNVTIYYPQSFPAKLIKEISNTGSNIIPVSSFNEIQANIFTLGEFKGAIPEQVLAIRSPKGIVVITGCAHPGIINILKKAQSDFPNETIYLACGGFHLYKMNNKEIADIVKKTSDLEIQFIAPSHCSGNNAKKAFKEVFQNNYIEIGAGKIINID